MYTHPETMRILSAEISNGLLAEAAHHRLLKAARHARRARRGRQHQGTRRNR
jgi:hypothetical protein